MVTSAATGATQKLPPKFKIVAIYIDMTIHCKALEEHFLMVFSFSIRPWGGAFWKISQKPQSLELSIYLFLCCIQCLGSDPLQKGILGVIHYKRVFSVTGSDPLQKGIQCRWE
jgi:hypothetical protein